MDQFPLGERPLVSKYAATPDLTSRANAAGSRLGKATVVASISDIGVAHTGEINSILTTVPSREIGVNWLGVPANRTLILAGELDWRGDFQRFAAARVSQIVSEF